MSALLNALIFAVTLVLVILAFRRDGKWSFEAGRHTFRFFTVQSNALCALSALGMLVAPGARWAWMFKYVGTAAVSVTMLTVFLFLGPTSGDLKKLLSGPDFFMHLVTPVMAVASFCLFERRGMSFVQALWGMLPVALYGPWYLYKVVFAPEGRRWKDFYGFNRDGKWPVTFGAMMAGSFAVCMGLMTLQNI